MPFQFWTKVNNTEQQVQIQELFKKEVFLPRQYILQGPRKVGATCEIYFEHGASACTFDLYRYGTAV
jgi:hypothetical protein